MPTVINYKLGDIIYRGFGLYQDYRIDTERPRYITDRLSSLFKEIYSDKLVDLIPSRARLIKRKK